MRPIHFFLILSISIIFIIGYFINYADAQIYPDEEIWVGGWKGLRLVPIYYVENIDNCGTYKAISDEIRGCYRAIEDYIELQEKSMWNWNMFGCTTRDHEIYHAWGYGHAQGPLGIYCPPPNPINYDKMQYNPVKHGDPFEDFWKNPELPARMIKWGQFK